MWTEKHLSCKSCTTFLPVVGSSVQCQSHWSRLTKPGLTEASLVLDSLPSTVHSTRLPCWKPVRGRFPTRHYAEFAWLNWPSLKQATAAQSPWKSEAQCVLLREHFSLGLRRRLRPRWSNYFKLQEHNKSHFTNSSLFSKSKTKLECCTLASKSN